MTRGLRRRLWLALLAPLGCGGGGGGGGGPVDPAFALPSDEAVRELLAARVDRGRHAGIVVGLLDADGTTRVVARGAGAGGRPLDARSVFEIGSVTKTFTALALADMAAAGLVRLDQPVAELLPPGAVVPTRGGRAIGLADLATHRSGLPRLPGNIAPRDSANPYADYDGARLLDFLAGHQLARDVGAGYEYSNLGAGLLGFALAARAGTSYEGLVAARVLGPLGMGETGIALAPALRERLAPGHDAAGRAVPGWDFDALAGAGALRSTAGDMLRYLAANVRPDDTPLGAAIRATHAARAPTGYPGLAVGLGWHRLARAGSDTLVWHNGGTGGYASFVGFLPARRVGVVVLTNSGLPVDDLALAVLGYRP